MLKTSASVVSCLRRSGFAQAGRLIEILNGDPAASPTRRRAQTWCSLFVAPCAPEGTPLVSIRLRPCLGKGASRGEESVLADSGRAGEKSGRFEHPA